MTDEGRAEQLVDVIRAEQVHHLDIRLVPPEDVTSVALRRWRSYARRHPKTPSFDERVLDLTKGLRDAYDPDKRLGGSPNMPEWEYFAKKIAPFLDALQAEEGGVPEERRASRRFRFRVLEDHRLHAFGDGRQWTEQLHAGQEIETSEEVAANRYRDRSPNWELIEVYEVDDGVERAPIDLQPSPRPLGVDDGG